MTILGTRLRAVANTLIGDRQADRVVPPTGTTARLTVFAAGAMAFLAVFALALSLAAGRLADRWETELTQSATLRITAPSGQADTQVRNALRILETTPGVVSSRALTPAEQRQLLEPWFGPDLPIDDLPIPRLIEVITSGDDFDSEGLHQRLAGEAPGAVLDDHTRWRKPLVHAAARLRALAFISILLIAATTAAIVTLAANAALSANSQVIRVLRAVGSTDTYITRAFVRRFTLRCLTGSAIGVAVASIAILLLPAGPEPDSFLTGLGFRGWHWFWPLVIPVLAATVAFVATRIAAQRILRETP